MSLLQDPSFESPDGLMSSIKKRAKKFIKKHAKDIINKAEKTLKKGKLTDEAKKILKQVTKEEERARPIVF